MFFIIILCNFRYIFITDPSSLHFEWGMIIPVFYLSFVGNAIPLTLVVVSSKMTSPLYVSIWSILQLPLGVLFAYILFNQTLQITDYIGGSLILVGLIFVIIGGFLEKKEQENEK